VSGTRQTGQVSNLGLGHQQSLAGLFAKIERQVLIFGTVGYAQVTHKFAATIRSASPALSAVTHVSILPDQFLARL
jgi:hypothetical protein